MLLYQDRLTPASSVIINKRHVKSFFWFQTGTHIHINFSNASFIASNPAGPDAVFLPFLILMSTKINFFSALYNIKICIEFHLDYQDVKDLGIFNDIRK